MERCQTEQEFHVRVLVEKWIDVRLGAESEEDASQRVQEALDDGVMLDRPFNVDEVQEQPPVIWSVAAVHGNR